MIFPSMKNPSQPIHVCAAVIRNNGRILLCTRPDGKHLEGLWEFPGGKADPGESDEQCLKREIREELSIDIIVLDLIFRIEHSYPGKDVEIVFYRAMQTDMAQQINVTEGQEFRWIELSGMKKLDLVPADAPFADWLLSAQL